MMNMHNDRKGSFDCSRFHLQVPVEDGNQGKGRAIKNEIARLTQFNVPSRQ